MTFFRDVFQTPALLVGLVALVGLAVQRKSLYEVMHGTFQTVLGFVVLAGGTQIIAGSLEYLSALIRTGFAIKALIPNNEAMIALALPTYGTAFALIMPVGMVVNVLIARYTRWKYIFLTGHHTLLMACVLAIVLTAAGVSGVTLIIVGGCILGVAMTFLPALAQPMMRQITGENKIAMGHFGMIGYVTAGWVGKLCGKPPVRPQQKGEQKQSFDSLFVIAITMIVLFLIASFAAGADHVSDMSKGKNLVVFALMQALTFTAGIFVMIKGVELMLSKITEAFQGISEKLVPNAIPALDCIVVFPYAPQMIVVGFIASFCGGLIGLALLQLFGLPLVLPDVAPHFFCGATAAIFGYALGSRRGAMIGAVVNGLMIAMFPAFLHPLLGEMSKSPVIFGDTDFTIVGIIIGYIAHLWN